MEIRSFSVSCFRILPSFSTLSVTAMLDLIFVSPSFCHLRKFSSVRADEYLGQRQSCVFSEVSSRFEICIENAPKTVTKEKRTRIENCYYFCYCYY